MIHNLTCCSPKFVLARFIDYTFHSMFSTFCVNARCLHASFPDRECVEHAKWFLDLVYLLYGCVREKAGPSNGEREEEDETEREG